MKAAMEVAPSVANMMRQNVVSHEPMLVADIGGTNARFAWVGPGRLVPGHVEVLSVADFPSPLEAVRHYLGLLNDRHGLHPTGLRRAALAVATPVSEDEVRFTNSPWHFSCQAIQEQLGLEQLLVMNDFEALAWALPGLQPDQIRTWHGDAAVLAGTGQGNLAVIGPGTGLGVAGLVQSRSSWLAVAGEGGHASLAPADDFEAEILACVRKRHAHVSAERLLSGIGLPLLYQAMGEVLACRTPHPEEPGDVSVAWIIAQGQADQGLNQASLASQALDTFCAMLGGFAGNVALTYGARGGLYIGGGLIPRLGDQFHGSRFRQRFEAKGRFSEYLRKIPVSVILDTQVALMGAAAALRQGSAATDQASR